jgi:membrane dipeptidase
VLLARARELARRTLIIDGHVDLPHRLSKSLTPEGQPSEDVSRRTAQGDFDHPRAVAGGLDAPFMSIFVSVEEQEPGQARARADELIDLVERLVRAAPDKFALARSPDEILRNQAAGRISLPLGIENGAAIENELGNLAHFHRRGVRYITLTHAAPNQICDSSYGERRVWGGLSPFGRRVVTEMNRLGIMIDVSHVSDDAFFQVLDLSAVPVIASHSSARHFTPGFERNMSDEMIRRLAARGGVVMINFGSGFVTAGANAYVQQKRLAIEAFRSREQLQRSDPRVEAFARDYERDHPPVLATVRDVADHIDHVVRLVGAAHVGLGSDFDGVGPSTPIGLRDVSHYPHLLRELLARGYSEADIARICGGNLLRVWRQVEAHAQRAKAAAGASGRRRG